MLNMYDKTVGHLGMGVTRYCYVKKRKNKKQKQNASGLVEAMDTQI